MCEIKFTLEPVHTFTYKYMLLLLFFSGTVGPTSDRKAQEQDSHF